MDITFSGFPIGRVRRVELADDGSARILIDVPRQDAHWLRMSSVFTLVRSLVGGANLRAYTGVPSDPPLPDGAERKVLIGDTAAELPRLVASARELLQNLAQLTAPDAPLATSLANLQALTDRAKGPRGAMGAVLQRRRCAEDQCRAGARRRAAGAPGRHGGQGRRATARHRRPGAAGQARRWPSSAPCWPTRARR